MVTTYNQKDMISFARYMFSPERKQRLELHPMAKSMPPIEVRLRDVSHADFENWKFNTEKKESETLRHMKDMCAHSLPPDLYEAWEEIQAALSLTRGVLRESTH